MHTDSRQDRAMVPLVPSEVNRLREGHYNATVRAVFPVHQDLVVIRVVPDGGVPSFAAGQFFTLGLGNWEPRVDGVDEEHLDEEHQRRISKRAYSASCSIFDGRRQLMRPTEFGYLEFYLALVRHAERRPPALTPRLFALKTGDRLFVSTEAAGHYTLAPVLAENDVFFFATGTGEAPHNAMIAELLAREHQGQIVSAVSVRLVRDAAYREAHEELMRRFPNYHYVLTPTREKDDPKGASAMVRSKHLQDLVTSGWLEGHAGVQLDPPRTQVFLCGNPAMIGLSPQATEQGYENGSLLDVLLQRGFHTDEHGRQGNVHFERYW